jgi:dTDP-4-amino-4,6-dideoxygalactose transaminase
MARAAAILIRETHAAAEREAAIRRRHARDYRRRIHFRPGVSAVSPPGDAVPGYLRMPIRLAGGLAGFAAPHRARRLGIASGYPSTLAALPAIRQRLVGDEQRWPGAEVLARELVTVPTHSRVSTGERDAIVELLNEHGATGD